RLRSGKATVLATARLNARSAGRRVGMGQHGDGGAAAMAPAAITLWRSAGVPVERGCDATRSPRAEANRVRSRAGTGWRGPTQAHGREAPWRGGAAARAMDVAGTRGARAAVLGLPVCGRYRASDRSSRAATKRRRPSMITALPYRKGGDGAGPGNDRVSASRPRVSSTHDRAQPTVAGGGPQGRRDHAYRPTARRRRGSGRAMKVLTFFNHAGGVAKTSTVRDVGYVLGERGHKVLLVDVDPQANLTRWLGLDDVELEETIYPGVMPTAAEEIDDPDAELALPTPKRVHGVDLIPSQLNVAILEREILSVFMGVVRLREAIRRLEGYDFVLIDPPPSLGQLSALAVVAADSVVVPVPTNRKGLDGLATVIKMVREYRKAAPRLDVDFFVLTQHDKRTRHDRESLDAIRKQLVSIAPVSTPLASRPA